jgi:hypothetical protein
LKGDFKCEDWRKIPCNRPEIDPGAEQIFPLLTHPNWRTPTVKHHCPRVVMAACIRSTSNINVPEVLVEKDYTKWFKEIYTPKIMKCFEKETVVIDFEVWLNGARYTVNYKDELRRALDPKNRDVVDHFKNEAFPKIEMQITDVVHCLKNTKWNTSKERQIVAPNSIHKAIINAFCNKLEEVFDKYLPGFCCRCNWMEICSKIEKFRLNLSDPIDGAGDQSAFDMSQVRARRQLVCDLFKRILKHVNVVVNEPLNKDDMEELIDESLCLLFISAERGQVKYFCDEQPSGIGWTMLMNTLLNLSYWEYTYHLAGIDKYWVFIKSDDSLFGHNKKDHLKFLDAVGKVFSRKRDATPHGLAQICKRLQFGDITELEFLSNHFFWTDYGTLRMTRIPHRIIQTLSWSTSVPKSLQGAKRELYKRNLLYSKGSCLLAWGTGLPIWENLGRKMCELGVKGDILIDQYSDAPRFWQPRNDFNAYMTYLSRFGMNIEMVINIARRIDALDYLSGSVDIPEFELFYCDT